jgi:hypothetical protein
MKRFLVGLIVAAVAAVGYGGVTALASGGNGAATPFKATYVSGAIDGGTNTWTCSGAHVVNKVSFKDSETCIVSGDVSGFANGTYSGNPTGFLAGSVFGTGTEWASDFKGEASAIAMTWTIVETDNGDGTFTLDIVAYYSS